MNAVSLRRAQATDAAAVQALTRIAYAKWVPLIGREPMPMKADYAKAVKEHLVDLYESDGHLMGLIEMIPAADHLLIENVAVHPSWQGRGLGAFLLAHAEATARAFKLGEVQLYTNSAFVQNIAFYEKRGYDAYLRRPFPLGGETVYMKKAVSGCSASQ